MNQSLVADESGLSDAKRIKRRISHSGIKQKHVAKMIDMNETLLSHILAERRPLTYDYKKKLFGYLGIEE